MQPLPGWAVIEPEEKKMEGAIELPDSAQGSMQQGTVVSVYPEYIKDGVQVTLGIKEGDRVAFRKYYENDLEAEGKKYKVVHCQEIMVIL